MIVCLDATTCRLRRDLAIWKHSVAEYGDTICDQAENVEL